MFRIVIFPKAMLQTVKSDLDKLEIIPVGVLQVMPNDLEMFAAHAIDLFLQPVFAVRPEAFNINRIFSDQTRDLVLRRRRMRIVVFACVWSQKASNAETVDFARRIRWRDANDVGPLALTRHLIPNGQVL